MYNFMKQREAFLYFLRRDGHRYFILLLFLQKQIIDIHLQRIF